MLKAKLAGVEMGPCKKKNHDQDPPLSPEGVRRGFLRTLGFLLLPPSAKARETRVAEEISDCRESRAKASAATYDATVWLASQGQLRGGGKVPEHKSE
jgi:hypothetical protein